MADTARPDLQLADAEAAVSSARHMLTLASQAERAASGQYDLARAADPAAPATNHARNAWAQALADQADARVALAAAQDQLRAIHRQPNSVPLGEQVRDALTGAGYKHADEGDGVDGFELHRPKSGPDTYVIVTLLFEGRLRDMGLPGVRRSWTANLCTALINAGFYTRVETVDDVPVWVSVARDKPGLEAAFHAIAEAVRRAEHPNPKEYETRA